MYHDQSTVNLEPINSPDMNVVGLIGQFKQSWYSIKLVIEHTYPGILAVRGHSGHICSNSPQYSWNTDPTDKGRVCRDRHTTMVSFVYQFLLSLGPPHSHSLCARGPQLLAHLARSSCTGWPHRHTALPETSSDPSICVGVTRKNTETPWLRETHGIE